jgi:hypothetical protein
VVAPTRFGDPFLKQTSMSPAMTVHHRSDLDILLQAMRRKKAVLLLKQIQARMAELDELTELIERQIIVDNEEDSVNADS